MWTTANYSRLIVNSLVVAVSVVVVTVAAAVLGGYAFAMMSFPGKKLLFPVLLVGLAVPFEGLILPLYFMLRN